MSDGGMWETEPEKPWYEPENPKRGVPVIRIVVIVIIVAIALILLGMPFYDPVSFVVAVGIISFFLVLDGLCNRELVRSLRSNHQDSP